MLLEQDQNMLTGVAASQNILTNYGKKKKKP